MMPINKNPTAAFAVDLTKAEPVLPLPPGRTMAGVAGLAGMGIFVMLGAGSAILGFIAGNVFTPIIYGIMCAGAAAILLRQAFPWGRAAFGKDGVEIALRGLLSSRFEFIPYADFEGVGWKLTPFGSGVVKTVFLLHPNSELDLPVFQTASDEWRDMFIFYSERFSLPAAMRTPSGVATFDPALAGSTLADLAAHGAISTDGDAGRTGAAYRMNTWILPAFGMAFCLLFIPITFYVDTTISFEGDMTLANIIGPFLALCAFICGVGLFRGLLWPPRIELHENELRVRMTAANAGRDTVIAFREINAIHNRSGRFGPIAYGLIDIVGGGKSTQLFTSHNAAVKLNDILYARAARI